MKRRSAAALCVLISAGTLMAMAGPASAASFQDFYLTKTGGIRFGVAQGLVVSGTGTFTETSGTSQTLHLPAGDVFLSQTPTSHVESLDRTTCRITVVEKGASEFSYTGPDGTQFGGDGTYTLSGSRTGRRVGTGCAFTSPELSQFALTAQSSNVFAVPPPPPPPPPPPLPPPSS